jgi:DNA/RNA-binding domain of Phe-tRNA-synthetase-like protein
MNPVAFSIARSVIAACPEIHVMALRVTVDDQTRLVPLIADLSEAADPMRTELASIESVSDLPEIMRWREAYASLGVKPSKFHSSIEALLRRIKKGQDISTGIPIVDCYNLVSISSKAPLGAYDVAKLGNTEVSLRHARPGSDRFEPLGGSAESFPLNPKLVVYGRDDDVICWGFNTRDSEAVSVDTGSTEIIFFSESTAREGARLSRNALDLLCAKLRAQGAATGEIKAFTAADPAGLI